MHGHRYLSLWLTALGTLLLALLSSSCSDSRSKAVHALNREGYEASMEDYLEAASAGDFKAMVLFGKTGFSPHDEDDSGDTVLIRAAAAGQRDIVEKLIEHGVDLNHPGHFGRSALVHAASYGHLDVVDLLLANGADPSQMDDQKWTAMTAAAWSGHTEVVGLMAQTVTDQVDDALLIASLYNHPRTVSALLDAQGWVDVRSPHTEQTPLMLAAQQGNMEVARLLVEEGANPYLLDADGKTAADLAEASGKIEVAAWLRLSPEQQKMHLAGEMIAPQPTPSLEPEVAEEPAEMAVVTEPVAEDAPSLEPEFQSRPERMEVAETAPSVRATPIAPASPYAGAEPATEAPAEGMAPPTAPLLPVTGQQQPAAPPTAPTQTSNEEDFTTLDGAVLHVDPVLSDDYLHQHFELRAYVDQPIPIALNGVDQDIAWFRVHYGDGTPMPVRIGEEVGNTGLILRDIHPLKSHGKEKQGEVLDNSSVTVYSPAQGDEHVLSVGREARSSSNHAVMRLENSAREFEVSGGERFQIARDGKPTANYRILEVRPTQVLIENTDTGQVVTVDRNQGPVDQI